MTKTFVTMSGATQAIKKAGLHVLPVEYRKVKGRFEPVVTCATREDADYVRDQKGFAAVVKKPAK